MGASGPSFFDVRTAVTLPPTEHLIGKKGN